MNSTPDYTNKRTNRCPQNAPTGSQISSHTLSLSIMWLYGRFIQRNTFCTKRCFKFRTNRGTIVNKVTQCVKRLTNLPVRIEPSHLVKCQAFNVEYSETRYCFAWHFTSSQIDQLTFLNRIFNARSVKSSCRRVA